jgi:hypothetical protein
MCPFSPFPHRFWSADDNSALLQVYSIGSGEQIRATRCGDIPLSSLALLPTAAAPGEGAGTVAGHPTVLAGSYDNRCYAYSVDWGRQLGSWPAHDDAVSCMKLLHTGGAAGRGLLTGSDMLFLYSVSVLL